MRRPRGSAITGTQLQRSVSLHPELTLARRAGAELDEETAERAVMYTSTEPCSMCATAMAVVGLGAVVYSVSGEKTAEIRGGPAGIPSEEVFDRYNADIDVVGPVGQAAGVAVHEKY